MEIFRKDKPTEEKFQEDKRRKALLTLLRVYRDDKFKIPRTSSGDKLIEMCNRIDPDKTLPEEELLDIILSSEEVEEFLKTMDNGIVLPDDVIKAYVEKFYNSLLDSIQSPDPNAWDTHEFQSQQLISVLSPAHFNRFKVELQQAMDADPKCPYFIKSKFMDLLGHIKSPPTREDEKTAEKIMRMVCSNLEKTNPEVFRALVDSLKWRGSKDLGKTLAAVKKTPPEKRKLKGRESCLFIESENTVHYVG